jgi:hypothetical protein
MHKSLFANAAVTLLCCMKSTQGNEQILKELFFQVMIPYLET